NDRWKAKTSFIDAAGRRHQPSIVVDTRKEAVAWLHRQHDQQNRGQHADAGKRTVAAWLDEWLTLKKPHVELRSFDNWEQHIRIHLKPAIGKLPLAKLRPSHVSGLYSTLTENGVSPAMRKKVAVTLSMALEDAVRHQYIATNPARAIKKPKAKEPDI